MLIEPTAYLISDYDTHFMHSLNAIKVCIKFFNLISFVDSKLFPFFPVYFYT